MSDRITLLFTIILILLISPVLLFSICEDVSGIWDQPEYIINNDIRILSGDTLIIENGVTVKFNGNYQFEINGSLFVLGTEGSKVQFESYQEDETWKGIVFCNSSSDSSYIHYAEIKDCLDQNGGGISILGYSKLLIENSKIFNCSAVFGGGIYINYAHPTIRDTEICNNYASDSGGGIYTYHCNIVLDNIHMHNNESVNNAGGASINYNHPMITNCLFEFNSTQGNGGGMLVQSLYVDSEIRDCIFRNNSSGMRGGGYYTDNSICYVYSSIFEENTSCLGGACFISNYGSFFINCKFSNNNSDFGGAIYMEFTNSRFINCLFSYNESDFGGAFYLTNHSSAEIINSNIVRNHAVYNGGDIDALPLFADSLTDFSLLTGSPCINVGTLDLPEGIVLPELDLAGNPRIYDDFVDMGAYEWQGTGVENYELTIASYTLQNYPNPFNPTTTISFSIPEENHVALSIYNIKGQKVSTLINEQMQKGEHSVLWSGVDALNKPVSSGIYLYKIKVGNQESIKRMLLLK